MNHAGGQAVTDALGQALRLAEDVRAELRDSQAEQAPPDEQNNYEVIIPVFNGHEELIRCLDSVLTHTDPRHIVHLVDDASPDPRIAPLLLRYEATHPQVQLTSLPQNLGFPGAVNHAMLRTRRDVVLLNSDTEVPAHWLPRLDRCRRSDTRLAAISPLSNNATLCSMPHHNAPGPLPRGQTLASMDRLVEKTSMRRYPRVPTVVGFCMLITRRALDAVGPFDCAFGKGYGEEVDFCQRAWAHGLESALCDDLFVYHKGEASFSELDQKRELQQSHERLLAQRWPSYHQNVATYSTLNPLGLHQKHLLDELQRGEETSTPRVLHVVHDYESNTGTAAYVRSLVRGMAPAVRQSILFPVPTASPRDATLVTTTEGLELRWNPLSQPVHHTLRGATLSLRSASAERFFAETIAALKVETVHFSHLANLGSLILPLIARALGTRVVLVLHDYYLLCPDWNLLDEGGRACGKSQVDTSEKCQRCLAAKGDSAPNAPPLELPEWLEQRQALTRLAAEQAHSLVAPSQFVKEQFTRAWGTRLGAKIEVIPHGTSLAPPVKRRRASRPQSSALRVGFLGNFLREKGRDTFLEAAKHLSEQSSTVQLSVLGKSDPALPNVPSNVELRGPYRPEQLSEWLREVDVVVVASVWHEVYCYTVDEALRRGTPVLASRAGALPERIQHEVNGLLFAPADAHDLVLAVTRLDQDRDLLANLKRGAKRTTLTSASVSLAKTRQVLLHSEPHDDVRSQVMRSLLRDNARCPIVPPLVAPPVDGYCETRSRQSKRTSVPKTIATRPGNGQRAGGAPD